MTKRLAIRFVVMALAGIGAASLIALVAAGIRSSTRETLFAYACEWRLLSDATCYPDTDRPSFYGEIAKQMAIEEEVKKELTPIIAEQERLKAEKRERDRNQRESDLQLYKSFIVGCERDKLVSMQGGKDVSNIDCRKNGAKILEQP